MMKTVFVPSLFVLILLFVAGCCDAAARTRTITSTAPNYLTVVKKQTTVIQFGRAGVFPPAQLDLSLSNTSFTLSTEECVNSLNAFSWVTGPGWLPELVPKEPFSPLANNKLLRITFVGTALFDARTHEADRSQYTIRLPTGCTSDILANSISFKIVETPKTQLGGVVAFSMLLAGTISFVAVLCGSSFAYIPVQIAVMIGSSGCSPIDIQGESYTTGFLMSPLPYTSRERFPHYRMLLCNLFVFFVVSILEIIHFGIRYKTCPAYSMRMMASLKGKRENFLSTYKPQANEKFPVPAEDVPKKPMPFYFLFGMFALLGTGNVYHATRVLVYEAIDAKHYGAAAVGLIVWFIFVGISFNVSLTKGAYYKPFSSFKKKLPRFITPDGCTGPNVFRLTFGVVIGDLRQGRRYAASFPIFYTAIFAVFTGATSASAVGCRTMLSLSWLATFLFGIWLYRSQPLRSTAANVLIVGGFIAMLVTLSSMLVYAGYGGHASPDSASGPVTAVCLIILNVFTIFSGIIALIVASWEGLGGEAMRCAKFSDGRGGGGMSVGSTDPVLGAVGTEVFERHVAFIVDDMRQLTSAGGGQPLEPDDNYVSGGVDHLQAPTLASFLMQDFAALPDTTKEGLVTSARIARQAKAIAPGVDGDSYRML